MTRTPTLFAPTLLSLILTLAVPATAGSPRLTVEVAWCGASAAEVEASLGLPLERLLGRVAGVTRIVGRAAEGRGRLALTFAEGTDPAAARAAVAAALRATPGQLPAEAGAPRLLDVDAQRAPVLWWTLTSAGRPLDALGAQAGAIARALREAVGVGAVVVAGRPAQRIEVTLAGDRLTASGLDARDVCAALSAQRGQRLLGSDATLSELAQTLVRKGDPPVRVRDVAQVAQALDWPDGRALLDGAPCVALGVVPVPGADVAAVAVAAKRALAAVRGRLPADVTLARLPDAAARGVRVELRAAPGVGLARPAASVGTLLAGRRLTWLDAVDGAPRARLWIRPASAVPDDLVRRLQAQLPGLEVRVVIARERRLSMWLVGPDRDVLRSAASAVAQRLATQPALQGLRLQGLREVPSLTLLARPRLSALGLTAADVRELLELRARGRTVGHVGRGAQRVPLVVRLAGDRPVMVKTPGGAQMPLTALLQPVRRSAPAVLLRVDGRPAIAMTALRTADTTAAEALAAIDAALKAVREELGLPGDYRRAR